MTPVVAAGVHRRTDAQRRDQRLAWERSDEAFFASGACHVLAWTCLYRDHGVGLAALRDVGELQVWHTWAVWEGWAFDASGWNPEVELLDANQRFEARVLERVSLPADLATFCVTQRHRMLGDYWGDPVPRAVAHVARFTPPWGA